MKKIKLLCFPYAGASASVYNSWKKYFDERIELVPIELAGRGKRFSEPLYNNMVEAIDDLYDVINPHINTGPYAFFGHSMGSWLVYELIHRMMKWRYEDPVHLFFSGRRAPHVIEEGKNYSEMDDEEFLDEIIKLGGLTQDIIENENFINVFLPIIRTDLNMLDHYQYEKKCKNLDCDITVLYGEQDNIPITYIQEWAMHTNKTCHIHAFKGDHFYFTKEMNRLADIINTVLIDTITRKHF